MEVSADNSFPDFRSPFPAPRSPLPVPRFSNIRETNLFWQGLNYIALQQTSEKKNTIWQANEGIYTFHVLFLWLKNTYTVRLQDLIPPKVVDFENLKCAS